MEGRILRIHWVCKFVDHFGDLLSYILSIFPIRSGFIDKRSIPQESYQAIREQKVKA
jgi:hypothetical protein